MPPNPVHVAYVRDRISAHRPAPMPGRRYFLDRREIDSRQIANRPEFDRLLQEKGFVTIDVASMSMAEQRKLFADAEIVLGALGTDLLVLYFAPPGCRIIPLTDDVKYDPYLAHTCMMLNMEFEIFICKIAGRSRVQLHKKDFDLFVDCDQLGRRIGSVTAG
jgi:capsular polysaccharide biosynthesis protein